MFCHATFIWLNISHITTFSGKFFHLFVLAMDVILVMSMDMRLGGLWLTWLTVFAMWLTPLANNELCG